MRARGRTADVDRAQRDERARARDHAQLAQFMRIAAQGMFGELARVPERIEVLGDETARCVLGFGNALADVHG